MDDEGPVEGRAEQVRQRAQWLIDEIEQLRLNEIGELLGAMTVLVPDAVEECLARVRHPSDGAVGRHTRPALARLLRVVPGQRHT
jgi:hypothetical protein